ncbi:MAG TPA: STAS domain-containing protein [Nocardioides sp.]|nr:STAS domain-containing protein [Nocardioides sp.]
MPQPAQHDGPTRLSDNLRAQVSPGERATVVRLDGELELTSVASLRREVLGLADDGQVVQVLDLSGVTFLDSAGLGFLVSIHRRLRARSGRLILVCSNEPILRLLRLTSLDRVFTVHETVDEALAAEPPG